MQKRTTGPLLLGLLIFLSASSVFAQSELIQLSGIVTDDQTLLPVPYAQVSVPASRHYTYSSVEGFFSMVVDPLDTIEFSALGYKTRMYVVPDSGFQVITSIAVFLSKDTLMLDAVEIYPWPSREEFRDAFLAYQESRENQIGPIPGIKSRNEIDTVPKAPSPIMNPISFLYEEVVKPVQWQKRKRKMVDKLPEWDDK